MSFSVTWIRDGEDEHGMQSFATEQEAMGAARAVVGVAFVHLEPSGSVTCFDHGRELDGAAAAELIGRFTDRPQPRRE